MNEYVDYYYHTLFLLYVQHVCSIFTEMYIHHVPVDDKDRLRRKVKFFLATCMYVRMYVCMYLSSINMANVYT